MWRFKKQKVAILNNINRFPFPLDFKNFINDQVNTKSLLALENATQNLVK